jgi:hypothetical protein
MLPVPLGLTAMLDSNVVDCRIYVESDLMPDEFARLLAASLGEGTVNGAVARTIHTPQAEIDVRKNKEANKPRAAEFPDGFLYFRYALEVHLCPTSRHAEQVALVDRLLKILWSQGIPAVAACDYENELPRAGGYNNRSIPWPSRVDDSSKDIGSADQQAAPARAENTPSDGVKHAAERQETRIRGSE